MTTSIMYKPVLTDADRQAIEVDLGNKVYRAAVDFFETLENHGHILGNGHHMAQKVSHYAASMLRERWGRGVVERIGDLAPDRIERAVEGYRRALTANYEDPNTGTLDIVRMEKTVRAAKLELDTAIEEEIRCERCNPRCASCARGDHISCQREPRSGPCCCR